jgi:hypothetical protein
LFELFSSFAVNVFFNLPRAASTSHPPLRQSPVHVVDGSVDLLRALEAAFAGIKRTIMMMETLLLE